jgi:predicted nucleotidyltransferase component of viral defense system
LRDPPRNLAASVRQRLLNHARTIGADPALVFLWYGLERFLYRLSVSPFRDRFILKGALLFRVWGNNEFRPTRDVDVLASLAADEGEVRRAITEVVSLKVADDGLAFDATRIRISEIREAQEYEGFRVALQALLGETRIPLQIDIGFGDAVTPAPVESAYPVLLEFPAPVLQVYPRETVIAEKLEAIVSLGMTNTRMKDYYDLWVLSRLFDFSGAILSRAIRATFERRRTLLPADLPIGLSADYAADVAHRAQWTAFLTRETREANSGVTLDVVVQDVSAFVLPPAQAAHGDHPFDKSWKAARGWSE